MSPSKGLIVTNEQTSAEGPILYLYYGAGASATQYTVAMPPGAYWEMPTPFLAWHSHRILVCRCRIRSHNGVDVNASLPLGAF